MRAELKRLHRQFGMTIIYATPDELEALSMGEEIAVMRDGAVVQRGTPDELYETPADLYVATKIGSPHMNLIEARSAQRHGDRKHALCIIAAAEARGRRCGRVQPECILGIRPCDIRLAERRAHSARRDRFICSSRLAM